MRSGVVTVWGIHTGVRRKESLLLDGKSIQVSSGTFTFTLDAFQSVALIQSNWQSKSQLCKKFNSFL